MHPIVRHYAYDHLTADKKRESHVELAMHFVDAMPVTNKNVKTLEDLAPVIELYHHMVGAGNLDEAFKLFRDRLAKPIYFQFGAYQLQIELLRALFLDGEDKPPRLKDESAQALVLNSIGAAYGMSGQPHYSVKLREKANAMLEKAGDKKSLATGLGNVAVRQMTIGALNNAECNLRRRIDLCREIADEYSEARGHHELSRVLSYCGKWQDAEQELNQAFSFVKKLSAPQAEGTIWSYRALRFLLLTRDNPRSQIVNLKSSIEYAQRALELADEWQKVTGRANPNPMDYTQGLWLLGAAYRSSAALRSAQNEANNELTLAEENLSKALNLCRQINAVDTEADILLDLARLRYAEGSRYASQSEATRPADEIEGYFKEALEKASEALVITERSGYVLQGADVHLFLAELAMKGFKSQVPSSMSDKEAAKFHAEEAKRLAYCDGGEYKYKVAYDEAERLLETLK
jgi:tetratricopeptide (TPR) repeat protein